MDTSIVINATTTDGKKVQKAITNINPAKGNAILNEFASRVNNLSTNTYAGGIRINKNALTEPDQTVTLTVDDTEIADCDSTVLSYKSYVPIEGGVRFTFDDNATIGKTYDIDVIIG